VRDQLRHARGDRLLLGETHRWRREGSAMLMGRGQIRTLLASNTGKVLRRMGEGPRRAATGDARGVADEEARSRKATEGICRKVTSDLFAIHVPLMQNILGLRSCYDKVGRLIYVWNRFIAKLGWRDERSRVLPQRIKESGLTGKPIETLIDHIEFDEGRDPVASRAWEKI